MAPKPYKFIRFGDIHGPKPYKFIGFGDVHGPKPYKFIGFGSLPGALLGYPAPLVTVINSFLDHVGGQILSTGRATQWSPTRSLITTKAG